MRKNNVDNRLTAQNKAKVKEFFDLMLYETDTNTYELLETKTAITLEHIPTGRKITKDLKNQIVRGLIEVSEESAKEQLKLMVDELKYGFDNQDDSDKKKIPVDEKIEKWFRIIADKEFDMLIVFDTVPKNDLDRHINNFKESLDNKIMIFDLIKESDLYKIDSRVIPEEQYKQGLDSVYYLLSEFKVNWYKKDREAVKETLMDYVVGKTQEYLRRYGIDTKLDFQVGVNGSARQAVGESLAHITCYMYLDPSEGYKDSEDDNVLKFNVTHELLDFNMQKAKQQYYSKFAEEYANKLKIFFDK